MKLPFINDDIFKPHKNPVEREKSYFIYIYIYRYMPILLCNLNKIWIGKILIGGLYKI